ncbi:hypothetical protein BCR33DRAFT_728940, partial [Rhizoclosmatium globosum]
LYDLLRRLELNMIDKCEYIGLKGHDTARNNEEFAALIRKKLKIESILHSFRFGFRRWSRKQSQCPKSGTSNLPQFNQAPSQSRLPL